MGPEVLANRLQDIENKAAHERAAAEYVCGVIEANEDALRAGFFSSPEHDSSDQALYDTVVKAFESISSIYTRVIGVTVYYLEPGIEKTDDPLAQLGWIRYSPAFIDQVDTSANAKRPHVRRVTEQGLEIVNGYRQACGYVTLEQQRQLNHDRSLASF